MKTRIKICGITSLEDALLAVDTGADYLGFIFVPSSPRAVETEIAREIIQAVQGHVRCVGVFQNQPLPWIQEIAMELQLDLVQLHGEESPADCRSLPVPVIKKLTLAYREGDSFLADVESYYPSVESNIHALLLEPPKGESLLDYLQRNGHSCCQELSQELSEIPHFLAGGLNLHNIDSVLKSLSPGGVDLASGVEASPGKKDPEKLISFCQQINAWDALKGGQPCNH